jgi:pilus assembly protein CpaC
MVRTGLLVLGAAAALAAVVVLSPAARNAATPASADAVEVAVTSDRRSPSGLLDPAATAAADRGVDGPTLANAQPIVPARLVLVAPQKTAPLAAAPVRTVAGDEMIAGAKGVFGARRPPWQAEVAAVGPAAGFTSTAVAAPVRFFVAAADPAEARPAAAGRAAAGRAADAALPAAVATSRISVRLNHSQTVQVAGAFAEAVVGSAEIADVLPMSDRMVYVLGKKIGATNLSVYNSQKRLVGVLDVEVTPDIVAVERRIRGAALGLKGVRVSYANGQIILDGSVPDAVAGERAYKIASAFSSTEQVVNALEIRSPQQVLLEVRVLEASRDAGRELGVQWNALSGRNRGAASGQNLGGQIGNALISGAAPYGVAIANLLSDSKLQLDLTVRALEEKGLVRRLAEPNLTALSGSKASFLAGGEFPIPLAGEANAVTGIRNATVSFKKFGVMLEFEPTVLANRQINLKLSPEVSELDFTQSVQSAGFSIPSVVVRRATTEIELRDGQSFAIAGLLRHELVQDAQQLPWLGSVPVLGALFRSQAYRRKETELLILVTARLARPQTPATRGRTPLDKTLPGNDVDLFLNGRQEIVTRPRNTGRATADASPAFGHILEMPARPGRDASAVRTGAL